MVATSPAVGRVRAFNRVVAERIGALNDSFLERGRPMAESRFLWEIGPDGVSVRELRARLGLDSGYTSRILRGLEGAGLIVVEASAEDGRVRFARWTTAGAQECAELDRRSDAVARSFLEPLSSAQQDRLVAAMGEVQRLLTASLVQLSVEDPTSADARLCLDSYFSELSTRFSDGFDVSRSISAFAHELVPPAGLLLLARLRDKPIGCGALKFHLPHEPVELKRMWVAPDARGLGVGRRLLAELEAHARAAGANVVHLETNRSLTEAIQLYRSSGYTEVARFNEEPYADHWFEKQLT